MPRPNTLIYLPNGQPVTGWKEAVAALGRTRQTLFERAQWDVAAQAWRISPPKPIGRPRKYTHQHRSESR